VLRRRILRSHAIGASIVVDVLYLLLSPVILLVYMIASRFLMREKYRRGFLQKLGVVPVRERGKPSIWVHAVSVGEVRTVAPLVDELAERLPEYDISISVTTYTGFAVARKQFPDREILYAPFDLSICALLSFRRRRPDALLLVELELWPNFLLVAQACGVPVLVVNGRLTERSCRGYSRARWFGRFLFGLVDRYAVQNEEYAERFARLQVDEGRLEVLGNLKHDRETSVTEEDTAALRRRLGWPSGDAVVLVGGSTHPSEEELLCRILSELREVEPRLRLVLVPRHVERFSKPEEETWGADRSIVRWSSIRDDESTAPLDDRILLVDTVGELEAFYAASDISVVGGSFIERGGHNVFEPAQLGRATCFGPNTSNFLDEVRVLLDADAARQVVEDELSTCLRGWLESPEEHVAIGRRAADAVSECRGAVDRHATWVTETLQLSMPRAN